MSPFFPRIICLTSFVLSPAEPSCSIDGAPQLQAFASKTKGGAKSMLQVAVHDADRYRSSQSGCACDTLVSLLKHNASLLTRKQHTARGSFKCPSSHAMQVMNEDAGNEAGRYVVKLLDIDGGWYTQLFSRQYSDPPSVTSINAVAVSHLDSYGYGIVRASDAGKPFVFVRFDSSELQFLKKIPGSAWISGTIDPAGDYFAWRNAPDGEEGFLKISDPTQIEHITDDPDQLDTIPSTDIIAVPRKNVADIVVFEADVGEGHHRYLLGIINQAKHLVMYNLDTDVCRDVTSNLPVDPMGWGSGWNFQNMIFFASNDGLGVYEIQVGTLDLEAKTVSSRKVCKSEATNANDGFNCLTGPSPFPNPDPDPPSKGCEPFCEDNGCPCLTPYAERCLLDSCNKCPFCLE